MQINLRPSDDPVQISWRRPSYVVVGPLPECIVTPMDPPVWSFDRAEWTVMVTSGLIRALGAPHGWDDWNEATAFRAPGVDERDHLLIVAALFLQGMSSGALGFLQLENEGRLPSAVARASRAIERLAERAAQYRMDEGLADDPLPWPRMWLLPDPSFQSPALEHMVEETHIDTLVDLAKHGEEATFKELARTLGVAADRVDELWAGTVRRIR